MKALVLSVIVALSAMVASCSKQQPERHGTRAAGGSVGTPASRELAFWGHPSEDRPWGIYLLSLDTGQVGVMHEGGSSPVLWSPDGKYVACAVGHPEPGLMLVPVARGVDPRVVCPAYFDDARFTPDGEYIVFKGDTFGGSKHGFWRVSIDGDELKLILEKSAYHMELSATAETIAYLADDPNRITFHIISTGEEYTVAEGVIGDPRVCPDDSMLAFHRSQPTNQICVHNTATRHTHTVHETTDAFCSDPTWSPQGDRLAFHTQKEMGHDTKLYVWSAADDAVTPLCCIEQASSDLHWSPEGTRLAFTGRQGDVWAVYVVDAEPNALPHPVWEYARMSGARRLGGSVEGDTIAWRPIAGR